MKANELRIGNWVQYQDFESPVQYHCIDGCNIERLWLDHDNDYYEPIPLTPEILEKCGFENYDNPNNTGSIIHNLNDFKIVNHKDGTFSLREGRSICFRYLHQLQNLYFALTGEELTVSLSEPASLSA